MITPKNKILLIEDDKSLSFFVQKRLETSDFFVNSAKNVKEGINEALTAKYNCIIVDIGLPDGNGFNVVKRIREENIKTPVIVITSEIDFTNEVETYNLGANIFHKKPINFELLEAQLMSLINYYSTKPIIKVNEIYVDQEKRYVKIGEEEVKLSYKEFELLTFLINANGNVLTRDDILNLTFKGNRDIEEGSVDTLVSRLRKKVGKINDEEIVETVHGLGYRLNLNLLK